MNSESEAAVHWRSPAQALPSQSERLCWTPPAWKLTAFPCSQLSLSLSLLLFGTKDSRRNPGPCQLKVITAFPCHQALLQDPVTQWPCLVLLPPPLAHFWISLAIAITGASIRMFCQGSSTASSLFRPQYTVKGGERIFGCFSPLTVQFFPQFSESLHGYD